jgi:hypothetical protein
MRCEKRLHRRKQTHAYGLYVKPLLYEGFKGKDLLFPYRPYVSSAGVSISLSRSYVEMRRASRSYDEKQAENADFERIPGDAMLDGLKIIVKEISNRI